MSASGPMALAELGSDGFVSAGLSFHQRNTMRARESDGILGGEVCFSASSSGQKIKSDISEALLGGESIGSTLCIIMAMTILAALVYIHICMDGVY